MKSVLVQFDFEGTTGSGAQGDIAIDDVRLLTGNCPHPGDCDFETDSCGWMNTDVDDFDWLRSAGATVTTGTGPNVDHSTNSDAGTYVCSAILKT